ncbi:MAG: Ig-like domain-containing protein [Patescibacteria group bacterium]
MKLTFKNVFSKLALGLFLALALIVSSPVYAAAPTGTSATLTGSTSSTVTITVTGTDFDQFISTQTTTAGATDLAKVSYNSQTPTAGVRTNVTTLTFTFPIATGTGKSGGSLVIAAGAVEDASNAANATITIANGSITDNAAPQVVSVTPVNAATEVNRSANIVIKFSETMTIASLAFSTNPSLTYTPAWSAAPRTDDTVTLSHAGVFLGHTTYTGTVGTGTTDLATAPNALAAPYVWSFTTKSGSGSITTTGGDSQTTTTTPTGSTTIDTTSTTITTTTTTTTTNDYSGCASASGYSTTTGKSCAGMPITSIAGCEGRNTGFSTVNGQSCVGNIVTTSTTVIAGCEGRNTGFSTVNGASCVGNTVTVSTPSYTSLMLTASVTKASSAATVQNLQAALNVALGMNLSTPLVVDGKWGAKTTAAVMQFQTWAGIAADGKVGPMTIAKLNAALK